MESKLKAGGVSPNAWKRWVKYPNQEVEIVQGALEMLGREPSDWLEYMMALGGYRSVKLLEFLDELEAEGYY